ncbi:MAG: sigma-70 family RNA polymerase sigma factor [Polyangiaceae bacterium]|nr:sigma-70 family RNA polymerase sigma factor [Polyangiaceae bacterium]
MLMMVLANPEKGWVLSALSAHEAALLRFAATIVGPVDARDVVQDTFLELCRARREDVEGHLVPWLFTVCRNRAVSLRRGAKRRASEEEVMGIASVEAGPHGELERKEAGETVAQLLEQLPERSREVVALKFAGGLSYKEIAEVTGLTVSHVGVILHEALSKVRERMLKKERALVFAQGRQS